VPKQSDKRLIKMISYLMLLSLYLYLVHTKPHGKYHFLFDVDDVLEKYHKYSYGKRV